MASNFLPTWSADSDVVSARTERFAILMVSRPDPDDPWLCEIKTGFRSGNRPTITALVDGTMADAQGWCDRWVAIVLRALDDGA